MKLKSLGVQKDLRSQTLMTEALDLLFAKHPFSLIRIPLMAKKSELGNQGCWTMGLPRTKRGTARAMMSRAGDNLRLQWPSCAKPEKTQLR